MGKLRGLLLKLCSVITIFVLPCAVHAAEKVWFTEGEKLLKFVDGGMVDAGSLIFSDNFDGKMSPEWKLDGAHMWKIEDNVLVTTGYGGQASLQKELGENFLVEVRMNPVAVDPGREGGFAGVSVSGILFTMQPGRWWWQYHVEGEERGRGHWKTEPVPLNRWYDFRIIRRNGVFEWFVDDRKICDIVEPGMKGGLRLQNWRMKTSYDSVKVYRIDEKTGTAAGQINLVRNSSFEESSDENLPTYWGPSGALTIPLTFGDMETFWESYIIDRSEKYHGAASLRLKGGKKGNSANSYWIDARTGKSYTVSLYMKSDTEGMPVNISLWGVKDSRKRMEVGTEWKRYVLNVPETGQKRIRIAISPSAEGYVWVDAVQMEEGAEPTEYHLNLLDVRTGGQMQEAKLPEYTIHSADNSPSVDGRLDDAVWNKNNEFPTLKVPGALPGQYFEPKEKTDGYICHDKDNLYIALKCYNPDNARVAAKDEDIEIFVDTNLDRKTYYRFILNPAGKVSEDDTLNTSWNGAWTAATEIHDGFWTAEVTIPLDSLELSPLTGNSWGINVGRTSRKAGEGAHIALTTNKGMYYHQVSRYPVFKFEDPGVLSGHFRAIERPVEKTGATFSIVADRSYYTTEESARVHVALGSGDEVLKNASVQWELKKDGKLIRKGAEEVKGMERRLEVPLADISAGTYEMVVRLLDRGKNVVVSANETIRKLKPASNEVKIDRVRRVLLVNGEPFFAFMPLQLFHVPAGHPYGNYDETIDTMMSWWAKHGFRALHVGANADMEWSERIWDKVFASAKEHNLKVVVFWTGHWYRVLLNDPEKLEKYILRWKDEPALLAWMPADEPEIASDLKPGDVAAGIRKVKELDPYHPVYINYTQIGPVSRYAGLPGDIMSLDYYLTAVEGRTIDECLRFADIMEKISEEMRTPTWNYIAGSTLFNHHREVSAGEQVAQTYGNVVKGVSGVGYFFGQVLGRKHWKAFIQLNEELQYLAPVIFSYETIKPAGVFPPTVLSMTRRYRDKVYIIAVNIYDREIAAVFDLSGMVNAEETKVLFEDRNIKSEGSLLKDIFKPYQRHIYEINIR